MTENAIHPDPEKVREGDEAEILKLYKYLSQFDRSAIQQAREEMTFWGWPSLFGKPPDGDDGLPDYKKPWMPDGIKTKASYLDAYRDILYIFI